MNRPQKFIGTILAVGVLAGIGVAAYQQQRPEAVVANALQSAAAAETYQFNGTLTMENAGATEQLLGEQGTVEIAMNGVFDRRAEQRDNVQTSLVLTAKTDSVSMQIEGELRFVDDNAYVLVTKAPQQVPALQVLKGMWLQLPRGEALTNEATPPATDQPLITNLQRQGRETIDGAATVHYSGVAQEQAVVAMMDEVAQLLGTRLTEEQIANIRSTFEQTGDVPVEVWVTPWGHELKRMDAVLAANDANVIRYSLQLSGRDKPVDITVPEDAISIQQLLQQQGGADVPTPIEQPEADQP